MDHDYTPLNDDEVLHVRNGRVLMPNSTFKVSEFLDALAQVVSEREDGWMEECEDWFNNQGLRCEVLRFSNQGWQRGRVRIRVEFLPEPQKLLKEQAPRRTNRPERAYRDAYPARVEEVPYEEFEDEY